MRAVDFKAKAHIFRNTAFMLKCSFKSAPIATILIYLAYISENVYYAVVFNVMFLQTALAIIEGNGTFREFVIKIGLIILGKLAVDLFGYVVFHPVRERYEIKYEGYINRLIFEKHSRLSSLVTRIPISLTTTTAQRGSLKKELTSVLLRVRHGLSVQL